MSIQNELNKIKNAIYGRDVRQAIHDGIKKAYDDASENDNANMEVKMARGSHNVLNDRLNDIEKTKRDKNQDIQMGDLSQEVKEAMTGGSVAVVGPDSVGNVNVKEEAIDPHKTNFFDKGNNLFNGTFMSGFSYYSSDGDFGYIAKSTEPNRYIALIPIEPGKTYNVTKLDGGNRFNLLLIDDYPRQDERSYASYRFIGGSGERTRTHTFTNEVNASYIALHTNANESILPKVIVTEGDYIQLEDTPRLKDKHYETAMKTTEGVLRYSYLEGFSYFSLIGGEHGSIAFTEDPGRFVAIAKIEKDKTYRVTKFNGGNRFNVALLKDAPVEGIAADLMRPVFAGEQSSEKQSYVFTNDVGANYVAIHTNSGSDNLANITITENTAIHSQYIPREYIPSDLVYPDVNVMRTDLNQLKHEYLEGFAYFSLIGGEYGSIAFTENPGRFVVITEIENNATYRITKFEGGNRFNVALISDFPMKGSPAHLLKEVYAGQQSSTKQSYVITNDVNAKYIAIHTNSGIDDLANIMITTTQAPHDEYVPYRYIPSELIYPKVEAATSKTYVIFDDLNGVYDNVDIVSFTNPTEVQAQEIYDLYDEFVTNYGDYVSQKHIGKDGEDNDMYVYHFKPVELETHMTYKLPKIIITTGTHGNEKSPVFGTYNMFKNICDNWRDSDILEFLRFNVEFIVIPITNPSGFNAHTRNNSNNVNLNRNFPTGWSSSGQQPGSGPASELETQNVISVLDEHSDADICIDYHNMYFRDGFMGYTWTADKFTSDITLSTLKTMGRKWQKDYEFFPQDENHKFGYSTEEIQGSLALHSASYGMKDNLLEIVREVKWQSDSSMYDELTILCAEEFLVNILKGSIKEGLM